MLIFTRRLCVPGLSASLADLPLDHEQRRRVRSRLQLVDGTPVALALPRGTVLHPGDHLETDAGDRTTIRAAAEHVCVARVNDPRQLARIAYHLGNRHAPVQLDGNTVYFSYHPLLARLCEKLGALVDDQYRSFEPESLGIGAQSQSHEHVQDEQATH